MPELWRLLPDFLPFGDSLRLQDAVVAHARRITGAEPWFEHAFRARARRRHVCLACRWLARALPAGAAVFEPGCGAGTNLLWLARQGLRIQGSDLAPEALEMCRILGAVCGAEPDVWTDDGVHPLRLPAPVDGILSVNWLYHVPGADMAGFLRAWRPALKPGGLLACDAPDISYNSVPGNEWHSRDLHLPEHERRPSEYRFRLGADDMRRLADAEGFRLERHALSRVGRLRRGIFLLRRA